jgi:hypothetical protein
VDAFNFAGLRRKMPISSPSQVAAIQEALSAAGIETIKID